MKNLSRVVTIFLFLPLLAFAGGPLDVVINEISWMGTTSSYNNEWVELYNNTSLTVNIDGWVLKATDDTPKINLAGTITANGFFLLERTDDNALPDIPADQTYTGVLENAGENLELYDNFGNLIDSLNCDADWFAGDNSTKQTMERENPLLNSDLNNWKTSLNPGGTPKDKNSAAMVNSSEEKNKDNESKTEPEPELLPSKEEIFPSGIVFNEILPSPVGPDEVEEWIEIFNQNEFKVDISNWQITDTEGKTTIYNFPEGTEIFPKEFLVLLRPDIKITLNNSGDGLNLIQPDGKITDSVGYKNAPRGQSYNLTETGWVWGFTLTPGLVNIIPAPIPEVKGVEIVEETALEKENPETTPEKELTAAIGEQVPKENLNLLRPFLIALIFAVLSGIIILIIKINLKKLYNKKV